MTSPPSVAVSDTDWALVLASAARRALSITVEVSCSMAAEV